MSNSYSPKARLHVNQSRFLSHDYIKPKTQEEIDQDNRAYVLILILVSLLVACLIFGIVYYYYSKWKNQREWEENWERE